MMDELLVLLGKLITREASMYVTKRMSKYALGDSSNCTLLPYAYIPASFLFPEQKIYPSLKILIS